ncbi:PH, RCC1 and FYVE domains-containing protein 1 [Spinacia oleracea]|uniref:PH, RCC1 and FYVE domains-containing protein 1 n=1 Tax=Spinacia oleracea TaxID=3562 RepID=A0A9R0IE98_SPIOL|nr:PH, RCC1 and FYVE domains-containing protein 1-like [Spinacia oleracea]
MADLVSYGHSDRDIDQALVILKKGSQLIKYSRKGKPKFCPFRLSVDEKTLIWLSHGEERTLKLSIVSKIIPGQRTAVFRRFLRPEKDYLSFSLIYNHGDRSLDLICKDKAEAEVWLAGLKALIGRQRRNRRTRSEIPDLHGGECAQNSRPALEFTTSVRGRTSLDWPSLSPDVGTEQANMQLRGSTAEGFRLSSDGFRLSVSSTPSCSSQGSGPDDIESLGDVYVWGKLWFDGGLDGSGNPNSTKIDVLTPKPLESNVVLDVHQIACGVCHIALVTRQGEVFTWGEESGGRLGHGMERDFTRPQLVEFLAITNVDFVACGEYHSCAVSTSGDLFTWGDGVHHVGLLGHGTDACHWIPKRVSGPLEGLQVLSIACGTWHSALTTSNGKLFTFGDGSYGVLGHGDRESVSYPKEVQQLNGLKTIKVSCGVWHTAAIVEVMSPSTSGSSISSRKLFTWGDGDKYRLGHGNKEPYLLPTCVSALIEYNFSQIACGHDFTVALTISGHVFTMGSSLHGQLGNPQAEGKSPCLVQDKLVGEYVEEISCGAHHVAVLTSRSEVYTWGKGANGRLGHGDLEDRKSPTMVEALKERLVKSVACGSDMTAVICIHKWVSGADQSVCSGCRQAFGFTRKRHNCYNCGLVHCHACSSKKAIRAALAPTPSKPHRVCDACYSKLKTAATGNATFFSKRPTSTPRRSIDSSTKERTDRVETRSSRLLLTPTTEPVKYLEVKSSQRYGGKLDSFSMVRASQVPTFQQLKDVAFPSSLSAIQSALRPASPSPPPAPPIPSSIPARPSSPYARRPSPPRSVAPVFSRGVLDSLKKSNELLSQEVSKLQNHLKTLKQKCDFQDEEISKLQRSAREASLFAADQSSKCKFAKEAVKAISVQLKDIIMKLPSEARQCENLKKMQTQILAFIEDDEASTSQTILPVELKHKQNESNQVDDKSGSVSLIHDSNQTPPSSSDPSRLSISGQDFHQTLSSSDTTVTPARHDSEVDPNQTSLSCGTTEATPLHDSKDGVQDSNQTPLSCATTEATPIHDSKDGVQDFNHTHLPSDATDTTTRHDSEDGVHESSEHSSVSNKVESSSNGSLEENGGVQEPTPSSSPNMEPTPCHRQENGITRLPSSRGESSKENSEQFERGVFVTFIQLHSGIKVFKRVKFSKRSYSESQAEEWWKVNRERVYQTYKPPPPPPPSNARKTSSATPSQVTKPLAPPPPPPSDEESNASAASL